MHTGMETTTSLRFGVPSQLVEDFITFAKSRKRTKTKVRLNKRMAEPIELRTLTINGKDIKSPFTNEVILCNQGTDHDITNDYTVRFARGKKRSGGTWKTKSLVDVPRIPISKATQITNDASQGNLLIIKNDMSRSVYKLEFRDEAALVLFQKEIQEKIKE